MNGLGFGPLATYRALSTELMSRLLSLPVGGGRLSRPRERSSKSPVRHRPNKPELPSEISLWRYFDLDRALNLLRTNTLKFTQLAMFDDGFEGDNRPQKLHRTLPIGARREFRFLKRSRNRCGRSKYSIGIIRMQVAGQL